MSFLQNLFDTSSFPPRWHCGDWSEGHGWLHILSDLGIWSAYFTIPLALVYFSLRRNDMPFRRIFLLFGSFILLCGLTHLMEAIIFWWPAYRLAGLLKLVTAIVSWITVIALIRIAPIALSMRSPEELEREIAAQELAEQALQEVNQHLERRVLDRTGELTEVNARLDAEREWFRTTLASIGDGVITTDVDGKVTSLNEVAVTLTGWSAEEAHAQPLTEVFHIVNEQTGASVANPALRALAEGRIVGLANGTILIGRDGVRRFIDDSAAPIKDRDGRITGAVLTFRDISEKYRSAKLLDYQSALNKAITQNATTAIFMIDTEDRCIFMNPSAESMTGFAFEEVRGSIIHDLIHHTRPDSSPYPISECPLHRALPEGQVVHNHEDQFFRRSGEAFPVRCNARPIFEGDNAIGTVIEVFDLTEQKKADEALRESDLRFTQLADAIPQLAWMAKPDGNIDWFNSRWAEYTGKDPADTAGWEWQSIHDPKVLPQVLQKWRHSLATGTPFDMVFPLLGRDGKFRPFLTRVMPFRDEKGRIVRWFGTNTDISDQQQIQAELRELASRLSEADRRKDEFLATLAHELRNPLAPIRTGLEVMKRSSQDPVALESVRSTIERQTQQLITLVDDLLDVSRITRGKLELRTCKVLVSDVVRSAVEASQSFISDAEHNLEVQLPEGEIELQADPHRLAQVLSNLLNNAAKYTPNGGTITLEVTSDDPSVFLTVRDTGIGIPVEMQQKIFEMFAQVHRTTNGPESGLGIGLTLVRELVELHGGQISVISAGLNQGTTFTVRLPRMAQLTQERAGTETTSTPEAPRVSRRVLIVDDNEDAAAMLTLVVKMLGNTVRTAHDGAQAIEVAADFRPDIVLMDIGMPKMNGYEAARYIRKQDWGQAMRLIALTGWGQEEDKQRTKEAGFDHHLVKPADPAELQALFERISRPDIT